MDVARSPVQTETAKNEVEDTLEDTLEDTARLKLVQSVWLVYLVHCLDFHNKDSF